MRTECCRAALEYAKKGFYVFPVPPGEKKSYKSEKYSNGQPWGKTRDEIDILRDWRRWPNANVGIPTGFDNGIWVLEVDTPEGHDVDGFASLDALVQQHSPLPETRIAESPSGSRHFYFAWPKEGSIVNSASKLAPGIDVRGEGGMVIAPPSIKPGVGKYKWVHEIDFVADAPPWLLELVLDKTTQAERIPGDTPIANLNIVGAALKVIPNEDIGWDDWNRIAMAVWGATSGHELGFCAFNTWSRKSKKYNEHATRERWQKLSSSPPLSIGAGTIFHLAQEALPGWRKAYEDSIKENPRPVIEVVGGQLSNIATRAEQILLDVNEQIYQRAYTMVRPISAPAKASHGREITIAQLAAVDPPWLRDTLGKHADFQRWSSTKKQWVSSDPPYETIATILARKGAWRFKRITGVITTPTMRADGSIVIDEGYDEETQLLLIDPPAMPEMPTNPSRGEALAALALIRDLLPEFSFADEASEAVALSAIITPVVRGAFPVAPLHVARAPVPGSGKSFLFDVVATICTGQAMPVMTVGRTEEETEKRLGACLLSGQPLISIDNVNGELFGDKLCVAIERPRVEIRILGKSEHTTIETNGTTFFCTGNNIVLVGDLTRRAITVTLDPKMERPELRVFKENPIKKIIDNRGAYVSAALTICRAYICAGRPDPARRLASFEGWSDTVRSALIWLGCADPVETVEAARAEDPEVSSLRDMLNNWAEVFGVGYQQRKTLTEVLHASTERDHGDLKWPELRAAIEAVAIAHSGQPDARALAKWMQRRKGRVIGDFTFSIKLTPARAAQWWVESLSGKKETGALAAWLHEKTQRQSPDLGSEQQQQERAAEDEIPF